MNTAKKIDSNQLPLILKEGEGETIRALGSEITFLARKHGAWSLTQVTAPRGVGAPRHDHDFDENYYVMSGELTLSVDCEEVVLGAGEFVHIPGGTVHGFKATSEEPARFVILQAPGDADDFFRACAREITNLPADFARVPEIAARHGIRVERSTCNTVG